MFRFDGKTTGSSRGTQARFAVLLAIPLLVIAIFAVYIYYPTATNQGYSPEQPIPFSHKLHAGNLKIDCKYCHQSAEKSIHATIPAPQTCFNCHRVVKTDSPHIQKMKALYDQGKPIEWIRVHELPDYVYFPHKRHVAKGIACQECHGPVQDMDRIFQAKQLTMGFCLDCHRGPAAPSSLLQRIRSEKGDPHLLKVGPDDCYACHQ